MDDGDTTKLRMEPFQLVKMSSVIFCQPNKLPRIKRFITSGLVRISREERMMTEFHISRVATFVEVSSSSLLPTTDKSVHSKIVYNANKDDTAGCCLDRRSGFLLASIDSF